jgi:hypothetical protein
MAETGERERESEREREGLIVSQCVSTREREVFASECVSVSVREWVCG